MSKQLFPLELLEKSPEEKLKFFKNHTVSHTFFEKTFQELSFAIQDAQPGTIIFLYGPSGVGKTTMLQLIERFFTKKFLPDLKTNLEMIPVVRVNAVETDFVGFDWKDFFQRLLVKLHDPFPENKLNLISSEEVYQKVQKLIDFRGYATSRKYRYTLENVIKHRQPKAILVDEAQHIGKVVTSRKLLNQLNVIKCLANESETVFVLSGTYDLIPFLNLNDQLARRSINIEFPRYKVEIKKDCEIFINTLRTFQQYIPIETIPDLVSNWDFFYERTLGCVGTLKDWLERSISLAFRDGEKEIKHIHWEKRSPKLSQCVIKLSEILNAENLLKEDENSWSKFKANLGITNIREESIDFTVKPKELQIKPPNKTSIKKRKKVGIRNPKRDPIKQ